MQNGDYILVVAPTGYPGKKYRGKYCYEHHLVWWKNTGEILTPPNVIHHIDGNKTNNNFSNLRIETISTHRKIHCRNKTMMKLVCAYCNIEFLREKRHVVHKNNISGRHYCTRHCMGKHYHILKKMAP